MKKLYIILFLSFLCLPDASAQYNDFINSLRRKKHNDTSKLVVVKQKAVIDTLYTTSKIKTFYWTTPYKNISKEDVSENNKVYRFTSFNRVHKWTKIECLDGKQMPLQGHFVPHSIRALLEKNCIGKIVGVNFKDVCSIKLISNFEGSEIVGEHGYDNKNNLVYTKSIIRTGDNNYIVRIMDCMGLPVKFEDNFNRVFSSPIRVSVNKDGIIVDVSLFDNKNDVNTDKDMSMVNYSNECYMSDIDTTLLNCDTIPYLQYLLTPYGKVAAYSARNELDDPDYFSLGEKTFSYKKYFINNVTKYYDEHYKEIKDFKVLRNNLDKVFAISNVDANAYKQGFRKNDIIIANDNYLLNLDRIENVSDFAKKWVEMVTPVNGTCRKMLVCRYDSTAFSKFRLVEIKNIDNSLFNGKIDVRMRYITDKYKKHLKGLMSGNVFYNSYKHDYIEKNLYLNKLRKCYIADISFKHHNDNLTDIEPVILLGIGVRDENSSWVFNHKDNVFSVDSLIKMRQGDANSFKPTDLFITTDGCNVRHIVTDDNLSDFCIYEISISDSIYSELCVYNKKIAREMNILMKPKPVINKKKIIGEWHVLSNDGDSQYSRNGKLRFYDTGECSGFIINYATLNTETDTAVFQIQKVYDGFWTINGNHIIFKPSLIANDVSIKCIDIFGSEDKESLMSQINNKLSLLKNSFMSNFKYVDSFINNDFYLKSYDDDNKLLNVFDGSDKGMVLSKIIE